jgi:hypothetical protein
MSELTDDELLDALGVDVAPIKSGGRTALEERLIAGFEDILRFYEANGRVPQHGEERDIFERIYAVRLDRLRAMPEARQLLETLDVHGLLEGGQHVTPLAEVDSMDDEALLAELGATDDDDITVLKHVSSYEAKRAAEEIANRTACVDFETFKPLFSEAEAGLKAGTWMTKPFVKNASIEVGDFFIIGGQVAYVAEMHEGNKTKDGRDNPRLRVIFDNHTESDLLLRSLSRSLYPDGDTPVGRRIIRKDEGPLFGSTSESNDIESGTIYVLRSNSPHPFVAEHRELIHKVGVTGGKVETRIADAENDPTYLLAEVEIVATYKLSGLNRTKLENVFHRIFAAAQLDLTIQDRFGHPVRPREWFLVPLHVIDEAVHRIRDGSITSYIYDPSTASLVLQLIKVNKNLF